MSLEVANVFREGGWGMYPTLVLGVMAFSRAVQMGVLRDGALRRSVTAFTWATAAAGLLGFVTGFIRSAQFIGRVPGEERLSILLAGLGESAHNLVLALIMIVLVQLALAFQSGGSPSPTHDA